MSDLGNDQVVEPEVDLTSTYSKKQKELRDLFVQQYLVDYDMTAAAQRCGYPKAYAIEYGRRFMDEPYVMQQIRKAETKPTEETAEDVNQRIMIGLWREANYRGPGSSQSARVAALSKLAAIQGMDAPSRSKVEINAGEGMPLGPGVFVVPGVVTAEQWAAAAEKQQAELVALPATSSVH